MSFERYPPRWLSRALRLAVRQGRLVKYASLSDPILEGPRPRLFQPMLLKGEGEVRFGSDVRIGVIASPAFYSSYAYIEARRSSARVELGDSVWVNNGFCAIAEEARIIVGARCVIGPRVTLFDSDFHPLDPELRQRGERPRCVDVSIGENVFVGAGATVLKGAKVGAHSVVAAGAVVAGEFPPRSLLAGVPARVVRSF